MDRYESAFHLTLRADKSILIKRLFNLQSYFHKAPEGSMKLICDCVTSWFHSGRLMISWELLVVERLAGRLIDHFIVGWFSGEGEVRFAVK